MTIPSFIKAARSFSESLSQIPQDNLPHDLVAEAKLILDTLRTNPGSIAFGIPEGQSLLPSESNLAFGLSSVWRNRWNNTNREKALWIDIHLASAEPSEDLNKAFDFEEERDHYIAEQMVGLLRLERVSIPRDLHQYIGRRRRGSKEKE